MSVEKVLTGPMQIGCLFTTVGLNHETSFETLSVKSCQGVAIY